MSLIWAEMVDNNSCSTSTYSKLLWTFVGVDCTDWQINFKSLLQSSELCSTQKSKLEISFNWFEKKIFQINEDPVIKVQPQQNIIKPFASLRFVQNLKRFGSNDVFCAKLLISPISIMIMYVVFYIWNQLTCLNTSFQRNSVTKHVIWD